MYCPPTLTWRVPRSTCSPPSAARPACAKLAQTNPSYDHVVIDTPPSLGLLTINALAADDEVIIPVSVSLFAMKGLAQLQETIARVRESLDRPEQVFRTDIPKNVKVEEVYSLQTNLYAYATLETSGTRNSCAEVERLTPDRASRSSARSPCAKGVRRMLSRREGLARHTPKPTPRDVSIIGAVCQHGALTREQVRRLFFHTSQGLSSVQAACRRLKLLAERGYLERLRLPTAMGSGPYVYLPGDQASVALSRDELLLSSHKRRNEQLTAWLARRLANGEWSALPTHLIVTCAGATAEPPGCVWHRPGQEEPMRLID
jgi:hypothetical protein